MIPCWGERWPLACTLLDGTQNSTEVGHPLTLVTSPLHVHNGGTYHVPEEDPMLSVMCNHTSSPFATVFDIAFPSGALGVTLVLLHAKDISR
ncbi:hypothetical protein GOP47_0029180 [Adiantum capillus-veneris]|nr:hypothetical protein GOP47_0029180 [Adiantum capillus-veneris]